MFSIVLCIVVCKLVDTLLILIAVNWNTKILWDF